MLSARSALPASALTVLTYHRVADPESLDGFEPDVAMEPARFDRQLATIARWFTFVGIDDIVAHITHGVRLPRAPALLAFDDGYRDNHDVVLPLLKRHGARAVFFVATSYVEQRRIFWWDRVSWVLGQSRLDRIALRHPTSLHLPLGTDRGARRRAVAHVLELIKRHFALDLPGFLDHLAEAAGVHLDAEGERALADRHVMTWDHVRALRNAGMDVASHTATHRVLQTLPTNDLARELHESREVLEDVLRVPVRALAYPVGRAPAYSREVREAVQTAGYRAAFSNRGGVNWCGRVDAMDLRRNCVAENP
jgi:peptidoglycan/xylan/chitin deacetylase (PgdA/CDA1 family)